MWYNLSHTVPPSVAILLYLSRKFETPDHWYPQDLQTRARVDEYLAWQHTALRSSCTRVLWQKVSFTGADTLEERRGSLLGCPGGVLSSLKIVWNGAEAVVQVLGHLLCMC